MNSSSDPLKKESPSSRLRSILQAETSEVPPPIEITPAPSRNLLERLPRASRPSPPAQESQPPPPAESPPRKPALRFSLPRLSKERLLPALWTIASILSLAVNAILLAVILLLFIFLRNLDLPISNPTTLIRLPLETVRGLYRNFEAMDRAHIITRIPVATSVPVQLEVCIRSDTVVTTNQDVIIPDARVTVQTGGLNITNASTRILLPANVQLPVNLDLCVPVETTIPVSLNVDVDIPLDQTDLHEPFTGLQDVLEPVYCLLDPQAVDSNGISICEKAKTP